MASDWQYSWPTQLHPEWELYGKFLFQQSLTWCVPYLVCWEGDKTRPTKRQSLQQRQWPWQRQRKRQRAFGKFFFQQSLAWGVPCFCCWEGDMTRQRQRQRQRQRPFGENLSIFLLQQSLAWGVPCLCCCVSRPHLHYNLTESQTSDQKAIFSCF